MNTVADQVTVARLLLVVGTTAAKGAIEYCLRRSCPQAQVDVYDPACGRPPADFDYSGYDLVVMDDELGDDDDIAWLAAIRRGRQAPPVVLLVSPASGQRALAALEAGAACLVDKDELSPRYFAQCAGGVLNRRAPELSPDPGQPQAAARSSTGSSAAAAPAAAAAAPASLPFGRSDPTAKTDRIPGYRLRGMLAEGGMARILLAEREEDKRLMVLKILQLERGGDPELLKRFMREYRLIGKLSHPNVIAIHERGFAAEFAYIAMEYCPRGDLRQRIRQPVPPRVALDYLQQIAEGLGAVHAEGIVHRDMKPGNVLFRDDATVVVTDFGIAKELVADNHLTHDDTVVGTVYYVSPEQIRGADVDLRSDLYSLGAVLYHTLTATPPFNGGNPWEVMQAHLANPIPRLPKPLEHCQPLIDGLLAKDPDERFQNTLELLSGIAWVRKGMG